MLVSIRRDVEQNIMIVHPADRHCQSSRQTLVERMRLNYSSQFNTRKTFIHTRCSPLYSYPVLSRITESRLAEPWSIFASKSMKTSLERASSTHIHQKCLLPLIWPILCSTTDRLKGDKLLRLKSNCYSYVINEEVGLLNCDRWRIGEGSRGRDRDDWEWRIESTEVLLSSLSPSVNWSCQKYAQLPINQVISNRMFPGTFWICVTSFLRVNTNWD